MEKKTMGTFISALRRAEGLTQQEVADRLLVSNRAVSRWERDEAAPDISLLPALADLFGVTVDELLRGERRRPPEPTPPSPAAEHPSDQTDAPPETPPPVSHDPRALRAARALCRREQGRAGTLLLIAAALVVAGYICLLGITYGLERVYIGFAVFSLFCVGSVVLSVIAVLRFSETLREQNPAEGDPALRLPAEHRAGLLAAYVRGCFVAVAAPCAGMVLALPLVLYKKKSYIDQCFMMAAEDYLVVALLLAVALAFTGWLSYRPFRTALCRKWAAALDIPGPVGFVPTHKAILRRLNLQQTIAAVAGLGGGLLLDIMLMSIVTNGHEDGWPVVMARAVIVGIIIAGAVLLPVFFLIQTHRRLVGDDRLARRDVRLSGIRNVIVILSSSVFWTTGITYVSWGFNWRPSLLRTTFEIVVWVCATLAVFAVTELIRRRGHT